MRLEELVTKRTALWGMGREGGSVYRAIRARYPTCELTVLNDTPLDANSAAVVRGDTSTKVLTGPEIKSALLDFDVIVRSPGVSIYRPEIIAAKNAGVRFTSATNIWRAENPRQKFFCVSGTKGKSTTSTLIQQCLQEAGLLAKLGGNVGVPLLSLENIQQSDIVIAELSSFQISDFDGEVDGALLLNIYPEHLDWHEGFENYRRDKLRLLKTVKPGGLRIINGNDPLLADFVREQGLSSVLTFGRNADLHFENDAIFDDKTELLPTKQLHIVGRHNFDNIAAALNAVRALGGDIRRALPAIENFRGLKHRLYVAGERDGLTFVDDSIATVPQAAMAAVKSFSHKAVTIIVGGFDRGLSWQDFARFLSESKLNAVITLGDTGKKISEELQKLHCSLVCHAVNDMAEAVGLARQLTPKGGVVLLSPAAPSFGMFKDFEERGEVFLLHGGF